MRVADTTLYETANSNLRKNRADMNELSQQAATQKRVTKPSDDPVAAGRVLGKRMALRGNSQHQRNLQYAKTHLQFTENALSEMVDHMMRLKELAVGQAGDAGASAQTRRMTAPEVEQIFDHMVKLGNSQFGDRFIFGGYKTTEKPFTQDGRYHGDMGEMMIRVGGGAHIGMNVPGSKLLLGQGLSQDGIAHVTTKQADSIEELLEQRADYKSKPYRTLPPDPSQQQGPGAPAEVEEPPTRAISFQEKGPVQRAPSSLRINTSPQVYQDSGSYADGVDEFGMVNYPGVNVFAVINKFEAALKTNDKAGIQDSIDNIDMAMDQLVMGRSSLGSRMNSINSSIEKLKVDEVNTKARISELEDADMFEVVSEMNKKETSLKASLQTAGKIIQPSLLDFLR